MELPSGRQVVQRVRDQMLSAVAPGLINEITETLVDQIFNASVSNW